MTRRSTCASTPSPARSAYFTSRSNGALWVGNVPTPAGTEPVLGMRTRGLSELADVLRRLGQDAVLLAGVDADVDRLLPGAATESARLAEVIDELRLTKDEWEVSRLRRPATPPRAGFADVARELPAVVGRADVRGERWLEGTFWRRARLEGNDVGYTSIVGSGRHATVLHWWRNDGVVEPGSLLLADMGVETDELYTADVTRTMPVSGQWTPEQLKVYRAVYEAQSAGIAEVKAGADFIAAHRAAMWVLADHLHAWGVLPVTAEAVLRRGPGAPRRRAAPPLHAAQHVAHRSGSTCTTAPRPAPRSTRRARWRPGTSSPSSRVCTSRSTTAASRRSCAASACGSRTTSSSPTGRRRTCRRRCRATRTRWCSGWPTCRRARPAP